MSEPEASQPAPADDAEKKSSLTPAERDAPLWAQALAIAVIVTAASAYLLSDRQQDPSPTTTEARPATKPRVAPVEEPEPPDPAMPEVDEAPAAAPVRPSASVREPVGDRDEASQPSPPAP
jgi:hypothetical protein